MKRLVLTASLAALGWYAGILAGAAVGALVAWFASALAGKLLGGAIAGLLGGLASAEKGTRRAVALTTGASTALAGAALLDVQTAPWLVGAALGAILGVSHAIAISASRRDMVARATITSIAWSIGFALLEYGGRFSKLGLLAPAVVVLAMAALATRRTPRVAIATA